MLINYFFCQTIASWNTTTTNTNNVCNVPPIDNGESVYVVILSAEAAPISPNDVTAVLNIAAPICCV